MPSSVIETDELLRAMPGNGTSTLVARACRTALESASRTTVAAESATSVPPAAASIGPSKVTRGRNPEALARLGDEPGDTRLEPGVAPRLQGEDGAADVGDREIELVDGRLDPMRRRSPARRHLARPCKLSPTANRRWMTVS